MQSGVVLRWLVCVTVLAGATSTLRSQDPCQPAFEGGPTFPIPANFGMSTMADFDADGHLDLSLGLDILLGDGTGSFPRAVRLDAPWDVAFDSLVEDFDHDGILDAVLVGFSSEEVLFYHGREDDGSSGFFEPGVSIVNPAEWPDGFWHLARADFNDDGWTDIVAISRSVSHAVLMSEDGRNYSVRRFPAQTTGHMVTTGDFDGDGNDDVALGAGTNLMLFAGLGDGTFAAGPPGLLRVGEATYPGHRFRSADVDRDGRSDLLATAASQIVLYLGADIDADTFALPRQPSRVLPVTGGVRFIEFGDVNSDGVLDVASLAVTQESVCRVFFGKDSSEGPVYVAGAPISTAIDNGGVLALNDVDADGAPDLIVTSERSSEARVFLNDGSCGADLFQRGDANRDGERNLTDAVSILSFLFLGGTLSCPAAAETDGDGELNLTDAVYLLNFLFLGGEIPVGDELVKC